MAIDTAQKRRSSAGARRLPWLRRFTLPIPDGTIDQADRQHLTGLYAGIEAGEEVTVYTPPLFTIARSHVATKTIARKYVESPPVARLHVKTLEIEQ